MRLVSGKVEGQHQERLAHLLLADQIPVRYFEPARPAFQLNLNGVLQGMNLL
jgi:hypothetical protein